MGLGRIDPRLKAEAITVAHSFLSQLQNIRKMKRIQGSSDATIKWRKSKEGVIRSIYSGQKYHSKTRGHNPPEYNIEEFRKWMLSQPKFEEIYQCWINSGYEKNKKPSVDRLNDKKGYCFGNIQLMTWEENNRKAYDDQISGRKGNNHRKVIQLNKDDKLICEYHSLREAERITGARMENIFKVCNGTRKSTGGFKWEYKISY